MCSIVVFEHFLILLNWDFATVFVRPKVLIVVHCSYKKSIIILLFMLCIVDLEYLQSTLC